MLTGLGHIIQIAFLLLAYTFVNGFAMNAGAKRIEKQQTTMTRSSNFLSRRILPFFDSQLFPREALLLSFVVAPFIYLVYERNLETALLNCS